ncbi:MAG: methylthioribulose 1-phosphate dehydratase [Alphaproteobacteria bacterium]|nr:methylthioribulose 1-phosphate dehydratase [Alphaproteobacteria bacterium]
MNPKDLHRDATVSARVAEDVIAAGIYVSARGWTPATAGNLSARIDAGSMAITASGVDKGALLPSDVLVYDFAGGRALGGRASSAETALHVERYTADATVGAVVHIHARNATVLSMATRGDVIRLEGYELLKALDGVRTHETPVDVPVFPNTQDMDALARDVRKRLGTGGDGAHTFGYLLAGHGLYAWGRTMADALRHTEALEFLLGCELERRRVA